MTAPSDEDIDALARAVEARIERQAAVLEEMAEDDGSWSGRQTQVDLRTNAL